MASVYREADPTHALPAIEFEGSDAITKAEGTTSANSARKLRLAAISSSDISSASGKSLRRRMQTSWWTSIGQLIAQSKERSGPRGSPAAARRRGCDEARIDSDVPDRDDLMWAFNQIWILASAHRGHERGPGRHPLEFSTSRCHAR